MAKNHEASLSDAERRAVQSWQGSPCTSPTAASQKVKKDPQSGTRVKRAQEVEGRRARLIRVQRNVCCGKKKNGTPSSRNAMSQFIFVCDECET